MKTFEFNEVFAQSLDAADPLQGFRNQFLVPEKNGKQRMYFLGNSLGLQPRSTSASINAILEHWADEGVESFFTGKAPWMELHNALLEPLSVIAGAKSSELSVMNQLTVNIHLMLVSFYRPNGRRNKILVESKAFPSDQYAVHSFLEHLGLDPSEILIEINAGNENVAMRNEEIVNAIELHADELALVFLGGINYYTGQLLDMQQISKAAREAGAMVGFDLAHAIGNVKLNLHDWDIDFACWCSYKYLNGGPGAVAAVFVHEKHHLDKGVKRLAGWWGYDKSARFAMHNRFLPEPDATGWQLSTPSILLYACLKSSLDIFTQAGWTNILDKQEKMKGWLSALMNNIGAEHFECLTPDARGCQVSLLFREKGRAVYDRLFEKGFMVDWREPNVIRLAPVPLYNTFTEVWQFYSALKAIIFEVYVSEKPIPA
jgi:kynureninase